MNNFPPWNPVYCMSDVVNACHSLAFYGKEKAI